MKNCKYCGKLFIPKTYNQVFCSAECKVSAKAKYNTDTRAQKRSEEWAKHEKTRKCLVCGEEFELQRQYRFKKYCSRTCSKRAERIYGNKREADLEYHNQERFGGNKYKVLERDNYTCQQCGNISQLVVHHIDESGQDEKPNNDMSNLITLCRSCHIRIHQIVPWNKKHISKEDIIKALEGREVKEVAELLGITRKTLLLKRKEYGIDLRR